VSFINALSLMANAKIEPKIDRNHMWVELRINELGM